ncbi:MAG TPA: 2-succinyl-6-hydroxy-2,4-cyclohexadiene-1-carboxylate synthase [Candidatus Sericytochromatia bacterium]
MHGFLGDGKEFNQVISLCSEQFYCLTVDLPGHGKTKVIDREEYYTMQNTAQALINLLEQLSIKKCFLVGYSMGGRLALYLTLHFPQYFSKVVLESTSPGLKTQEEQLKRIQNDEKLARELETSDFSSFLLKWYDQPLFASIKSHPEFTQIMAIRLQNQPLALAKSLRAMSLGRQPSLWSELKDNKIPLLLLVGEYDEKFKKINTEMASICKFAKLEIISSCGHNIHLESVRVFVQHVTTFLAA